VRHGNAGERLVYTRLPTGVRVIGVNAGYTFSFVRDAAEELRWAAVSAEGSQFRSRDLFPEAAAAIAMGRPDALADNLRPEDVPEVLARRVAYVDGYGNLKTTIEQSMAPAPSGSMVRVRIGEIELEAIVADGSFAVEPGRLALAPGSSGWTDRSGGDTCWMELFLRGGNAWETFGRPTIGASIHFEADA
jgi:S-adenosylmethionine hydrolase